MEKIQKYKSGFTIALIITLLAKGQSIINPMPSTDAWSSMSSWSNVPYELILSQYRYAQILLHWSYDLLGLRTQLVAFASIGIALVMSVIAGIAFLRFIYPEGTIDWRLGVGAALFAIHPNFSEIFTFADVTLDVCISLFLCASALHLAAMGRKSTFIISFIFMFISLNIYQISINYATVAIIFRFIATPLSTGRFSLPIRPIISMAIALIIYLILIKMSEFILNSGSSDGRSQFLSLSDIPSRILLYIQSIEFAFSPFWVPKATSAIAMFASGIGFIAICSVCYNRAGWLTLIILPVALFGALIAVVGVAGLSANPWIVPRVLAASSLVISTIIYIALCISVPKFATHTISIATVISIVGYIALNNRVFSEHQKLVEWDKSLANRVLSRLESLPEFSHMETVTFIGYPERRPPLYTQIGDLQLSATVASWSKSAFFEQATGLKLSRNATQQEYDLAADRCKAMGVSYPEAGSVFISDKVGIVCLSF